MCSVTKQRSKQRRGVGWLVLVDDDLSRNQRRRRLSGGVVDRRDSDKIRRHGVRAALLYCIVLLYWRRSTVVERWPFTGELSLSCARLLAGRTITLWVRRPLSVSQHGQLSHPSLRGR